MEVSSEVMNDKTSDFTRAMFIRRMEVTPESMHRWMTKNPQIHMPRAGGEIPRKWPRMFDPVSRARVPWAGPMRGILRNVAASVMLPRAGGTLFAPLSQSARQGSAASGGHPKHTVADNRDHT